MQRDGRPLAKAAGRLQPVRAHDSERDMLFRRLMVSAQAGDRAAYDKLLRDIIPVIRRMARQDGIAGELIDDLIQDVLLTIHRARHTYDPARPFIVWVSMITSRRASDLLRSNYRRTSREMYAPAEYENFAAPERTDGAYQSEHHITEVNDIIEGLPEAQREAVEQLAIQQLTLQQAARLTGRSVGALKVNLHRALKALRARARGKDGDV